MKAVYIHIPFCDSICSYCDFPKIFNYSNLVDDYLDVLEEEIKNRYKKEFITSIYIGGGTPSSLNINQLTRLFDIIKIFKKNNDTEITIECNIENLTYEKLTLIKKHVNRLSIGIQTFNDLFLSFLNRNYTEKDIYEKLSLVKKLGFNNVNIDLIYALKNQSLNDLNNDIDEFLKLGFNHISTYSLMICPNTKLYLQKEENIDEDLDRDMYDLICKKLKENGYIHYEISNFSKKGFESKHNLIYWNNLEYYGFGMGASSYIENIRSDNTKSINKYLNKEFTLENEILSKEDIIKYELILGFRKIKGINKKDFFKKYNIDIKEISSIQKLLDSQKLLENNEYIYINPDYIYISNSILMEFV